MNLRAPTMVGVLAMDSIRTSCDESETASRLRENSDSSHRGRRGGAVQRYGTALADHSTVLRAFDAQRYLLWSEIRVACNHKCSTLSESSVGTATSVGSRVILQAVVIKLPQQQASSGPPSRARAAECSAERNSSSRWMAPSRQDVLELTSNGSSGARRCPSQASEMPFSRSSDKQAPKPSQHRDSYPRNLDYPGAPLK